MHKNWLPKTGLLALAISMGLMQGCDGCGCEKPAEVAVAQPAAKPEGVPGLPAPDPEPVIIGPDSPDAELAKHFGISEGRIAALKKEHGALPGIVRPAGARAPAAKPKQIDPTDKAKDLPIPAEPDPVLSGPERVTTLPSLKIILGHEFKAAKNLTPDELANETDRLRRLLFNKKVTAFAEPVLLIDSTLENPQSDVNVTVGIPVPSGFDVPPGLKVKTVEAGKCLYANSMHVAEVALTEDSWKTMTSPDFTGLIKTPCRLSVLVDLAGWPKADSQSTGDGYFFCN